MKTSYFLKEIFKRILMVLPLFPSTQINAQNEAVPEANIDIIVRTKIHAPAEEVWELLGKQFADISDWSDIVQTSQALRKDELPESAFSPASTAPVPARQTTVENKGKIKTLVEILTHYSDADRSLKFYGVGLPGFIAFASDEQTVVAIDDQTSEVVFHLEMKVNGVFRLMKGKIEDRFAENLGNLQQELKTAVESTP